MLQLLNKSIVYKDKHTTTRINKWNYLYVYVLQPYTKNVNINLLYTVY